MVDSLSRKLENLRHDGYSGGLTIARGIKPINHL